MLALALGGLVKLNCNFDTGVVILPEDGEEVVEDVRGICRSEKSPGREEVAESDGA
jgi:hypothetical protein